MEDYLTEDDQWEALKRWLKENGAWIIGGVVLGAALLFGFRWREDHIARNAESASGEYEQMQAALKAHKDARATELAGELQQDFAGTPYADHAQLSLAADEVHKGQLDKAAQRLAAVADKSDDAHLRQIARVRLARVQLAQNKPDDALATLGKVKEGSFSGLVSQVRGDVLLSKGDRKGALEAYRAALLDVGPGGMIDANELQLKVNDLAAEAPPVPAPAAAAKDAPAKAPTKEAAK